MSANPFASPASGPFVLIVCKASDLTLASASIEDAEHGSWSDGLMDGGRLVVFCSCDRHAGSSIVVNPTELAGLVAKARRKGALITRHRIK